MAEATGSSGGQGSGGGAGIYLIGVLVLAAASVGIYFATRGKDGGAAPTATVAATQEPAPKKLSGPAPPAPPSDDEIDDEPTASASASASAAPSGSAKSGSNSGVAGSGGGACGACGKEPRKSSSALNAKVQSVAGSAQGCYNRALRTSAASGTLTVSVTVGTGGASCGVSIVSDTVGNSEISSCVLGRFQGQSWPAPDEGCVTLNVPITFKIAN